MSLSLQTTKKNFVEVTESQVQDFVKTTVEFQDRMNVKGPVKCTDLDLGLQLLVEFQVTSSPT